ncbi:MAG TPA: SDR family oxidoreductase [Tepidisphaeraceae bacterium]|nr:SDR family oxidoreductase [Tepidisphaeraceae bacterium]HUB25955.1 SDR family oxidoreductase [Tepidisphaeraceae bacterium]
MRKTVAIVTGASQGIGRATAVRLARDFSGLVLAARNKAAMEEVGREIRAIGAETVILDLDLGKPEAAAEVVDAAMRKFDRIDALLNIAGAVPQLDLFEMTDEQWRSGMELKLHGARRLTIKAWDALKRSKGSVAFMSGSAALDPKPGFAAVAATNAAIIAMAKAFAEQGIKDGVQVNSIIPGAVMTNRRKTFMDKWAPAHNMTVEEAMRKFPEEAGISRYGQPEEVADLMAFMVSPAAKWMTGTSVRIDGGEVKGI